jgi:hypothetical protein
MRTAIWRGFHLIRASLYENFKEPLKKDVSLSLDVGRIEFCEGLRGADVALFRDSLRAVLCVLKKIWKKKERDVVFILKRLASFFGR